MLKVILFQDFDIRKIDFGYVNKNDGVTIYRRCFEKYAKARFGLKKPKSEWSKLIPKTEEMFLYLVEQGIENEYNVENILEIPDSTGSTCFSVASQCSEKICNYIIERRVKINSIRTDMMVPHFLYPNLAVQMMAKGINPHVINFTENSQVDLYPSSFESEKAQRLLSQFQRSVHFSIEDIKCKETCPQDCPSKFRKFYCKNGPLVEMKDENRIGEGGFGMVFRQLFHGEPMAMKCMLIGKIEGRNLIMDAVSELEKNISEIRIQFATSGSGVIVPVAFVRQQNQEQDANGKWIAKNYNIYIYPLYDCNLYELHENNFDQFNEEIVADIIHQCFTRIGSYKGFEIKFTTCGLTRF